MTRSNKLHSVKTIAEFENGYWYSVELKTFAKEIGVANYSKLRKDQLEEIIKTYLQTGRAPSKGTSPNKGKGNSDKLALEEPIQYYASNKKTKSFIIAEAHKLCPDLPKKSGVWYWSNRWREAQLESQLNITYLDLIRHFVKLSTQEGRLPQIPSTRFNNFISDFLAANEGNRDEAKIAWEQLKSWEIPKTYLAWKEHTT